MINNIEDKQRQEKVMKEHIDRLKAEIEALKFNTGCSSALISSLIETRNKNMASIKSIECILKTNCDYETLMELFDTRHDVKPCKFDLEEIINENFLLGFITKTRSKKFLQRIKQILKKKDEN